MQPVFSAYVLAAYKTRPYFRYFWIGANTSDTRRS